MTKRELEEMHSRFQEEEITLNQFYRGRLEKRIKRITTSIVFGLYPIIITVLFLIKIELGAICLMFSIIPASIFYILLSEEMLEFWKKVLAKLDYRNKIHELESRKEERQRFLEFYDRMKTDKDFAEAFLKELQ